MRSGWFLGRAPVPVVVTVLICVGCTSAGGVDDKAATRAPTVAPTSPPSGAPALRVDVVVDGLDHAWDVVQAPDRTLLVDERPGGFTAVLPDGSVREVDADLADLFAQGETGLMGLALDPAFATNRRVYTCGGVAGGGGASIAVIAWTAAGDWSSLTRTDDPLVGHIPVNERSGRHGGCRLRFAPDGALLIGTGDNAVGTNPQDLGSLGGKVLRVDAATGGPAEGNPFADTDVVGAAYVWTFGHRNVQGLAVRPGSGQIFAVEHGPDVDDEVNLLAPGANYGWNPDGAGSYDESVPMTDLGIPDAVPAVWSSGAPTVAPSGATFLDGPQWGAYDGLLLVGLLRGTGVLALRLDDAGVLVEQFRLPELDGTEGRIRSLTQGVDGALYVTTDNGSGADRVLKVTPS